MPLLKAVLPVNVSFCATINNFLFFLFRSPSPEPIYNTEGKRLNTREFRVRKSLEEERHRLVLIAQRLNTDYKPPSDYK